MKHQRVLRFAAELPTHLAAELEALDAAAWAIDVSGGRFLAANGPGAALLGLTGSRPPSPMDGSMPALVRLRALAASGESAASSDTLVFWTRGGVLSIPCRIEFSTDNARAVARVVAVGRIDALIADTVAAPVGSSGGPDHIARRIRAGGPPGPARRRALPLRGEPRPMHDGTEGRHAAAGFAEGSADASFGASLAHELRTPVSAIAAAAEIMRDERFGPLGGARYVGYAGDIHASALHVLSVIDRMMAAGALEVSDIDTADILSSSVSQTAPLAERAGLTLRLDLPHRLPHLLGDATHLRQILLNLLANALKFTPAGGQVTVAARHQPDGRLSISVADTGPGMAQHEIDRLTDPSGIPAGLQRSGRRSANEGLGLGLPLVRAQAAANGGELRIESRQGHGTTISIVFGAEQVVAH